MKNYRNLTQSLYTTKLLWTWRLIQHRCSIYLIRSLSSALSFRGCLHDTGATFAQERVHSGFLSWLYIVYMIPPQNVMLVLVTLAWVHPGSCAGERISLWYEISQWYHVNVKRPPVSVWNRSAGRLERVAHAWRLRFWITRVFYQHEVYLQITRYEMTQSSCKRDTKSKSHPGMKLVPVRVFSCKHPLNSSFLASVFSW